MGETDTPVLGHEHTRILSLGYCRRSSKVIWQRGHDRIGRRPGQRGHHQDRFPRRAGKRLDASGRQLLHALRHRKRSMFTQTSGPASRGPGDLDREERITTRRLRDPRDHGAGRRSAGAFAHDVMQ